MVRPPRFIWTAALPSAVVANLASLGPLGRSPKAPGTIGSLAGVALYAVFFHRAGPVGFLLLAAVLTYLAMAVCDAAEKRFMQRDPGWIVLDECIAFPLVFFGLQGAVVALGGWPMLLAGFVLFRLFDILKPFGIARLQNLPGGIGCVADDLAAALAANLVLRLAIFLLA